MGLYSVNRLTNIGFSNLIRESLNDVDNIEETVEPISLTEALAYIQEEEQNVFDSVIQSDFEELFFKSGLNTTVNEADENKPEEKKEEKKDNNGEKKGIIRTIWDKIKEILGKVKNAVINAFNAISRKLEELFKADEKIIAKYKPAIEKCNTFNNFKFDETEIALDLQANIISKINEGLKSIRSKLATIDIKSREAVESVTAEIGTTTKEVEKIINEGFKKYTTLSKDQILKLIDILDPKKQKAKYFDALSNSVNFVVKQTEEVEKKAETEADKDSKEDAHETYKLVTISSKSLIKLSQMAINAIKKNVAVARRILILAGRYALNETADDAELKTDEKKEEKKTDQKKQESEEEAAIISMASDLYISEMLAF